MPTGEVAANFHQFFVADQDIYFPAPGLPRFPNGLATANPGMVLVNTGVHSGNCRLEVNSHDAAPDSGDGLDGWEDVGEATLHTPSGRLRIAAVMVDQPKVFASLTDDGPGFYRVRVHARGRDRGIDLTVFEPVEDYRIDLWPASSQEPDTLLKSTSRYGATSRAQVQ